MTHTLPLDVARCDGSIPNDSETEPCKRRETCQRYIAHKVDTGWRTVWYVAPVRNCNMYIQGKS